MYDSAARTTVNQMGEATYIVGRGSEGLLENADTYMATESKRRRSEAREASPDE